MENVLNCMSLFNNKNNSRTAGLHERLHTSGLFSPNIDLIKTRA